MSTKEVGSMGYRSYGVNRLWGVEREEVLVRERDAGN